MCNIEYLEKNILHDNYQSAYCRGHSTELALLKVHTDIAEAVDEGSMAVLIMPDSSVTREVTGHPKSLKCLERL